MKMEFKDYEPIKFEIFQSDMEAIMESLNVPISDYPEDSETYRKAKKVKYDLQCKIDWHKRNGEWK